MAFATALKQEVIEEGIKLEMPELANEQVLAMEEGEAEDKARSMANYGQMMPQLEDGCLGQDKSIWRDLERILPVGSPAKMDEIRCIYRVSGPSYRPKSNFIYLKCSSVKKYTCKYVLRWRRADGMVQAKGEHSHKKFSLPQNARQTGRREDEAGEEEEGQEDDLDDLKRIFATAIEEERGKERQRQAAASLIHKLTSHRSPQSTESCSASMASSAF